MDNIKRVALVVISFIFMIIYAAPNLAFFFAVATVVVSEWISAIACLVFTWNIAKMVESGYERYVNRTSEGTDDSTNVRDEAKHLDNRKQKEWVDGEGYSYYIEDDEITFQFRNIKDHDGRQLSRLKFMREKFFKDK